MTDTPRPARWDMKLDAEDRRDIAICDAQDRARRLVAIDLLCELTIARMFKEHDEVERIIDALARAQVDAGAAKARTNAAEDRAEWLADQRRIAA